MATSADKLTLQQILSVLPPGERKGNEIVTECPACHERHLHVSNGNSAPVVKCWTPDCATGAAWKAITEKLAVPKVPLGLTVEHYAQLKGLNADWLRLMFGVYDTNYKGHPAVAFPYSIEVNGKWELAGIKIRKSASAHDTVWLPGKTGKARIVPYGLPIPFDASYNELVLVEGESDTHTLLMHGIGALGLPGAKTWKPEFAQLEKIRKAQTVYIVQEPDKDGEDFVQRIARDIPAEKIRIITLPVKDPSELHVKDLDSYKQRIKRRPSDDPEFPDVRIEECGFIKEWEAAVANARPLDTKPQADLIAEPEIKEEAEEPFPEFPKLPGLVGQFCDAITPDIPYEYRALAALTFIGHRLAISRYVLKSEPWLEPRFYACLIGPKGTGKSAACNEIESTLGEGVNTLLSVDSGPALVEELHQNEKHEALLFPDELDAVFEKAKRGKDGSNTLFSEFLRLYEKGNTGSRTVSKNRGRQDVKEARFSMLGGATFSGFEQMWTATHGSGGGLQSRFVITAAKKQMPTLKTQTDFSAVSRVLSELCPRLEVSHDLKMASLAAEILEGWSVLQNQESEHWARIPDMVKRLAMILAACDGSEEITAEHIIAATDFGDYQMALRTRLLPQDSSSWVQAMENRILECFKRHGKLSERNIRKLVHPERHAGGFDAFNRAFAALMRAGAVVRVGQTIQKTAIYGLD